MTITPPSHNATDLQEVLYVLLHFTINKRKCISQMDIRNITMQNCITARMTDLRKLGVVIKHFTKTTKNDFKRSKTYGIFFIPQSNWPHAINVYKGLIK